MDYRDNARRKETAKVLSRHAVAKTYGACVVGKVALFRGTPNTKPDFGESRSAVPCPKKTKSKERKTSAWKLFVRDVCVCVYAYVKQSRYTGSAPPYRALSTLDRMWRERNVFRYVYLCRLYNRIRILTHTGYMSRSDAQRSVCPDATTTWCYKISHARKVFKGGGRRPKTSRLREIIELGWRHDSLALLYNER